MGNRLSTYPTRLLSKIAGVDASGNVGLANAPAGVFYAGTTFASVLTAAALANSAGGGFVDIPAGIFMATEGLPAYPYVHYRGAAWGPANSGSLTAAAGGTIFVPSTSGLIGYGYNTADLGSPPASSGAFIANMLIGAGLSNISFVGFDYGIKIGGKYNAGCQSCKFENVECINSVQWDMWFENFWCSEFGHLIVQAWGAGAIAFVGSGSSTGLQNDGNSTVEFASVNKNAYLTRGICVWGRFASDVNNLKMTAPQVQSNGAGSTTITQAATMANGSANIGVTDSTKFPVGMPVTFAASVNGFIGATTTPTANQTYFVLTSAANVITVGLKTYGSAVVATGNTAVNVQSKGHAHFEIMGLDAGSFTTAINIEGADTEANTSARFVLQNAFFTEITGGYVGASTGTNEYATFVLRDSPRNFIHCLKPYSIDLDAGSNGEFRGDTDSTASEVRSRQSFVAGFSIGVGQALSFSNNPYIYNDGAGILSQRDGAQPMSYHVYNTYSGAGANKELFGMSWNASNQASIGTGKAGTGASRGFFIDIGGTHIADVGIGFASGFYIYNDVNCKTNFIANDFTPPITGSFAGTGRFYTHQTSGTVFVTNSTGVNYCSMALNGANLYGLGTSSNGTTQSTNSFQWDHQNNAVVGNGSGASLAALATNATNGFLYIPTCAGTPTGVPTAFTGHVAMIYDTTNNKLYIYSGGAWKGGTTPGAFT